MQLPDDWSFQMAQAFLAAAVSCEGISCDRTMVVDGVIPEAPPPGCACQLSVRVDEGIELVPGQSNCGVRIVADVTVYLDMCITPPPNQQEIPNTQKVTEQAQRNAAMRWGITRGLRDAWLSGALQPWLCDLGPLAPSAAARSFLPGKWQPVRATGGSGRWTTLWRYHEDR